MKKLFISLVILLTACSDGQHKHSKHVRSAPIHSYSKMDNSGDWIYYYIIFSTMNNSCPCYYYTSTTPVTDFSKADFEKIATVPEEISSSSDVTVGEIQEVASTQLPQEVSEEFNENFDSNDGWGGSNQQGSEEDGANEGTESSSSSESSGGSSDGGSSGGD